MKTHLHRFLLALVLVCVASQSYAALGTGTIFQVQSTATGSQVNGGGFNPNNANFLTDGAATSATGNSPVFTSASYNFVAGDVGAWIYIKSGTNWTSGYYQIASVAANAATLSAAIGQAVAPDGNNIFKANTVAGVATTASPTAATWGIDYSQQNSTSDTNTDLATANGTTNPCQVTSTGFPFGVQDVGNLIHINSGTNWTAGWYEIVSVSSVTATLDKACASLAAATGGTYHVGGALDNFTTADTSLWPASPVNAVMFVKGGSSITYSPAAGVTSTSSGQTFNPIRLEGFVSLRGDRPTSTTRPTIAMAANTFTTAAYWEVRNLQTTSSNATATLHDNASGGDKFINVKSINTSTGGGAAFFIAGSTNNNGPEIVEACEAVSHVGDAIYAASAPGIIISDSYIHDSLNGITMTNAAGNITVVNNVVANITTAAINSSGGTLGVVIKGNTIYGAENVLGTCIKNSMGSPYNWLVEDNIIYGCVTGVSWATNKNGPWADYNDYFNNTTNRTNFLTGDHDLAVNPGFTNTTQITGTTATTTAGNHLVQSGATFQTAGVTAGRDFIYIKSGTGVTAGIYGIASVDSQTQITTDITLTANATADKTWQINTGHDFSVGTNLKAQGYPGAFPAGLTTGYTDIGAVQRQESTGGGSCTFGDAGSWLDKLPANDNYETQYRRAM